MENVLTFCPNFHKNDWFSLKQINGIFAGCEYLAECQELFLNIIMNTPFPRLPFLAQDRFHVYNLIPKFKLKRGPGKEDLGQRIMFAEAE